MMRLIVLAAAAAAPSPAPVTHAKVDVPQEHGAQVVIVQSRDFPAGAEAGWHVHSGTETAVVISGEMEMITAGGVRRYGPGESFTMPRGTAHNGVNAGKDVARVVITLVVDKGAPPRQPVPAPVGR
jgi:quercetin dioxygenase-like cupin family protein